MMYSSFASAAGSAGSSGIGHGSDSTYTMQAPMPSSVPSSVSDYFTGASGGSVFPSAASASASASPSAAVMAVAAGHKDQVPTVVALAKDGLAKSTKEEDKKIVWIGNIDRTFHLSDADVGALLFKTDSDFHDYRRKVLQEQKERDREKGRRKPRPVYPEDDLVDQCHMTIHRKWTQLPICPPEIRDDVFYLRQHTSSCSERPIIQPKGEQGTMCYMDILDAVSSRCCGEDEKEAKQAAVLEITLDYIATFHPDGTRQIRNNSSEKTKAATKADKDSTPGDKKTEREEQKDEDEEEEEGEDSDYVDEDDDEEEDENEGEDEAEEAEEVENEGDDEEEEDEGDVKEDEAKEKQIKQQLLREKELKEKRQQAMTHVITGGTRAPITKSSSPASATAVTHDVGDRKSAPPPPSKTSAKTSAKASSASSPIPIPSAGSGPSSRPKSSKPSQVEPKKPRRLDSQTSQQPAKSSKA